MSSQTIFWPDLMFGPINLWSLPRPVYQPVQEEISFKEPKMTAPISTEQKLEILDWLTTKFVIRDIDAWENDATMLFPSFFVQFLDVSELDDPYRAMYNAMKADKQFPRTLEEQEAWSKTCKEIEDEVAKEH